MAQKTLRAAAVHLTTICACATAHATEIVVMTSGGFTAALQTLAGSYEKKTGNKVTLVFGSSMGTAETAIPVRLQRGERADLLVMVGYALGGLVDKGIVRADSRVDLVDSKIAMAVREGQPKPDISTIDAFKKALLAAKSIAYSDSASGVYIEKEMYAKLGLESELKPKSRVIVAEPVGKVVARGGADVGFQQVPELLPVKGIVFVGPIPDAVQKVTTFSAGIPVAAKEPAAAAALLAYLRSPEARPAIVASGLSPIAP
ncbi:MAG: substrate-binding domain-containing protein [Hyphomicrobiales bacterium]|nr:substrate-binding domain-containing protein [Hyphomicrobiales bacterium]